VDDSDDDDDDDDDGDDDNLIYLQLQELEKFLTRLGFACMPICHEYGYTVLHNLNITRTKQNL
jgi:hypothetical protein